MKQGWEHIEATPFVDNWHIQAICEHLEAVTRGDIMKLLINIPPGCMKSMLVCVFWFCWEWANDPSKRFMYFSYDQQLSTRDSLKCRALMQTDWYRSQWKVNFTDDQNQKTKYDTVEGGYRQATTPGGHGTGEHPDRIVVDDPHNVKKAESERDRQTIREWWDLTMTSRGMSRNARRVGVMQRLHEQDWTGHVLAEGDWVHLCLPMRYERDRMPTTPLGFNDPRTEEGELLTPLFSDAQVKTIEARMGSYGSAGQLQQRPAPRKGGFFKVEKLVPLKVLPADVKKLVRYWDKAGTDAAGDYTSGVLMGEHDGKFYIVDVTRGQWSHGKRDDYIDLTASVDQTTYGAAVQIWFEQEPGSGGKQSAEISISRLRGYRAHAEPPQGNKEARADQFASQMEAGNVYILEGPWNKAYIEELLSFPNGSHDDQVDGSSGAFNRLAKPRGRLLVATS